MSGLINQTDGSPIAPGLTTLLHSLQILFAKYDTCFLTLHCSTCVVIHENNMFAVVDSHARNALGLVDPDGRSVVAYFHNLQELYTHALALAASQHVSNQAFEVAGVRAIPRMSAIESMCLPSSSRVHTEILSKMKSVYADVQQEVSHSKQGCSSSTSVHRKQGLKRQRFVHAPAAKRAKTNNFGDDVFIVKDTNNTSANNSNDVVCIDDAISQTDDDVMCVGNGAQQDLVFNPLQLEVAKVLCNTLGIECQKVDVEGFVAGILGPPCKKQPIVGDGNCFFRAVSHVLSGSEKFHRKVRLAVCKHIECHPGSYEHILRNEFTSVKEYVHMSRMRYVGSWATEVEIQAAADCFGVSIFTYIDNRWLQYSCQGRQLSEQAVYLENCNNIHYEAVVCVRQPNVDCDCCDFCKGAVAHSTNYGLTQVSKDAPYNLRTGCQDFKQQSHHILSPSHHEKRLSKYLKKKKFLQMKINYHKNFLDYNRRNQHVRNRYKHNLLYQQKLKALSKVKYLDEVHKEDVKNRIKIKYRDDNTHRQIVKNRSKDRSNIKYRDDHTHREIVKNRSRDRSKSKYRDDNTHRQITKDRSREISKVKYGKAAFRQTKINLVKTNYHQNPEHFLASKKLRILKRKAKLEQMDFVIEQFLEKIKDGPAFVCSVCHRLLFKHQVSRCKLDKYSSNTKTAGVAARCIKDVYVHKCMSSCAVPCVLKASPRGSLWICHSCHGKVSKGDEPAESASNNLTVDPIPPELACLNRLESHLIALHIPFLKMVALPRGGQNGVHGPIACVPANIVQTSNALPRSNMEGSVIPVKLKRKLTYKGHYAYEYVDPMHIKKALHYLKENNPFYKDVQFNDDWINEFCRDESADKQQQSIVDEQGGSNAESSEASAAEAAAAEEELLHDRQQHCMFQDTCSMPVDIGQEALDQYFDGVLNLAPADGQNPVKVLTTKENEAKCFPVLFPKGRGTFFDNRKFSLTLFRYLSNRLYHADGRFAQNIEFIFYACYMLELHQVMSSVSIALRKGKASKVRTKISDVLKDEDNLRDLLNHDDGYRFLKPVRGTPAFWQGIQKDLLACLRQLGKPAWFCSFSAADLRWKEYLENILRAEGRTQTFEDLEWADKCDLLRRNPVLAARMFDYRWHLFLKEVLMSPANPIGKILDYFYRVEFQQRGSPHVHCLFWIENAPVIDVNTDDEVVQFIDRYVSCELPNNTDDLHEVVSSVQQHSKQHSKTCKKGGKQCRFNFPKPVSARTFISRAYKEVEMECVCQRNVHNIVEQCTCGKEENEKKHKQEGEFAVKVFELIAKALSDENCTIQTADELFASIGIRQETFEAAYRRLGKKTEVIMRRQVTDTWINPHSKTLLKAWNANMDIQYVTDAYACVVYIISYISKAERQMGLMLANAQREASKEDNLSAKQALNRLGSVYLHNRDVGAQEAVYKLSNMHLKECSRKVVFVPTGDNVVRISKPLTVLKDMAAESTEQMWMINFVDRYKNRPRDHIFEAMCLVHFAAEYRVLYKGEKSKNRIELDNGCGSVLRRTRTQPAVVRYARFSETKSPELFHQSILQLFLPYRTEEQLKPEGFVTFEDFYKTGRVIIADGQLRSVKSVVDSNRCNYEIDADDLDEVLDSVNFDGPLEDAWGQLFPQQETERLESIQERAEQIEVDNNPVEHIPDLAGGIEQAKVTKCNNLSRSEGLALCRSLNDDQMRVLNKVHQWCVVKAAGRNPDPFYVFVTGGAGVGKSHLIRAIQYEATRLLSPMCRQPDNISILLTAPTGIAAYNLHATTLHSTFSIGKDVRLPYVPIGEEKLNTLRMKYCDLQILIIDEISMVDHNMLTYVHGRLRQIKQTGIHTPFGNVSVMAVGDFYQLPPVKGKPLYMEPLGVDLWSTHFKVVKLTKVIRQTDEDFAGLLNRVRTHPKDSDMLQSDITTLKQRETGEECSGLHIFATNSQVNEHNFEQLQRTCPDYHVIQAQDYINNSKTGKLELKKGYHTLTYNTCLDAKLLLGTGSRVMLTKNLDLADGLVNGACGTVTDVVCVENEKFPQCIFVKFDDEVVGVERRKQSGRVSDHLVGSTAITPEEERVTKKGGMRRQFPLRLAWACTVHKVQGLTVDTAIVSMKKVFSAGQAYVALSRVRTLMGLIIQDFNPKKIYCRPEIAQATSRMASFLEPITWQGRVEDTLTVFLMNVQGLRRHVSDLAQHTQHLQPECIAVTETWLHPGCSSETLKIANYSLHSCPRALAYDGQTAPFASLQAKEHGGVAMYCDGIMQFAIIKVPCFNVECLVYHCINLNIFLTVIYRPPTYPMTLFKQNIIKLLQWLEQIGKNIIVMGDFNDDILKASSICKFFQDRGYDQVITQPTTERGTLIDHVYVRGGIFHTQAEVMPSYFSDHEGIYCSFKICD
ncbi:uncharacterized protein LOC121898666 isoform X1 [Xyrichtys novacula]|nr:uncharacterized protein LOC121898666 isoform X1 [Xyrichtys novacula]